MWGYRKRISGVSSGDHKVSTHRLVMHGIKHSSLTLGLSLRSALYHFPKLFTGLSKTIGMMVSLILKRNLS